MEQSSFFNSISGDRVYKAEDWATYFASFIGNGVFATPSTNLYVQANNDMTITVKIGKAWINGYFYNNTSDLVIALATADGVLNRIDRVVVQWNLTNRAINIVVNKGTPASSPIAPECIRNADIYELVLADISVSKGAITIAQKNITDRRLNTELCGSVYGVITQIDISTISSQFNDYFNDMKSRIDNNYVMYNNLITQYFEDNKNQINIDYNDYHTKITQYFEQNKNQIDTEYAEFQTQIETYFTQCKSNIDISYDSYIEQMNIYLNNYITFLNDYKSQSEIEYNALIAWFESFKVNSTTIFNDWFNDLQATLDGDTAGNLLNLINALTTRVIVNENDIALLKTGVGQLENSVTALENTDVELRSDIEDLQNANVLNKQNIVELDNRVTLLETDTRLVCSGFLGNAYLGTTYLS